VAPGHDVRPRFFPGWSKISIVEFANLAHISPDFGEVALLPLEENLSIAVRDALRMRILGVPRRS
jgi:hypothetical protein